MGAFRTIEVKQSVFADNDRTADALRARLKREGTFLLNLMSSPGSGKTTTLMRTIEALSGELSKLRGEGLLDYRKNKFTLAPGTGGGE